MIAQIINYAVRGFIVLLGLAFLTGFVDMPGQDSTLLRVIGVVFVLFGVYRIVIFYSQNKRYNLMEDDDDEE